MDFSEISMLQPTEEEIDTCIKDDIKYKTYSDRYIYFQCLADLNNIKSKNYEEIVHGPIKMFLVNWGQLYRVLSREKYKDVWEKKLEKTLSDLSSKLEYYQRNRLENENIKDNEKLRKDVKECYNKIKECVGITGASKVLHIICPQFFPLWDTNIKKKAKEELKANKEEKIKINDSWEGYYNFMKLTKDFINKYPIVTNLGQKHSKSALKIADEFFYKTSRTIQ